MENYAVVAGILALALLSYLAVIAGDKWTRVLIVLAFLGIARSVTQPFAQMLAYVCSVSFMLGVVGNLGQGALSGHYLWSSLSKEETRDQGA